MSRKYTGLVKEQSEPIHAEELVEFVECVMEKLEKDNKWMASKLEELESSTEDTKNMELIHRRQVG